MSRDPQLRPGRVLRSGLGSLGPLLGSVAEELKDSMLVEWFTRRCGPLGVDLRLVWTTFNEWFNVELWLLPAYGSRVSMRAA